MSCERYAAAIVDHACGADLAADAAAHLRGCAACTAMFNEQRRAIAALDGELQAALSIDASSAFADHVRARIASSSSRRTAVFWWCGAAAAAAALIVTALLRQGAPVAQPAPTTAMATEPPAVAAVTPAERQPDEQPKPASGSRNSERSAIRRETPARPPQESEIVVEGDRQRAVSRYLALLRSGALDTSNLAAPGQDAIVPPLDLSISPIAVDPIAIPSVQFAANSVVNDGMQKE